MTLFILIVICAAVGIFLADPDAGQGRMFWETSKLVVNTYLKIGLLFLGGILLLFFILWIASTCS